jgi:hypothetical protein
LSCPLILLTLGLLVLVINGVTLWLASAIAVGWFHVGFYVDGFWAAFLGAFHRELGVLCSQHAFQRTRAAVNLRPGEGPLIQGSSPVAGLASKLH